MAGGILDTDPITAHHLSNIKNNKSVNNKDGSTSTVRTIQVDFGGVPTLIPTVYDGKILSNNEAIERARGSGVTWPTAKTHEELSAYDKQIHQRFAGDLKQAPQEKDMPEQGNAITQQDLLSLFMQTGKTEDIKLNQGLLSGDQKGFMDVLKNPDQAQVSALVGGLAGAVNPRGRDPALMGIAQGAQAFQGARQQEYDNKIKAEELRQDQLKNRLQGALGIGNFGVAQGAQQLAVDKDQRAQVQQGVTNTLEQNKFNFQKNKAGSTGQVTMPDGTTSRGFIGSNGRVFGFDTSGRAIDISGKGGQFKKDIASQVNVKTGESSLAKEVSKRFAGSLVDNFDSVQGMVVSLPSFVEAERIVNDPNAQMFTGAAADVATSFGSFLSSVGFEGATDPTANTQAFTSAMGNEVLNILGSGALGAGTGISDKDKEFAAKIAGGSATLDRKAIKRIMSLNKRIKRNLVLEHNKRINRVDELPVDLSVEMPVELMSTKELRDIMSR